MSGYPPQPPYGQPPYREPAWGLPPQMPPTRYGPQPVTSGLAIASLVTGLVGFCCLPLGIVAIVLGIMAIGQINNPANAKTGTGISIAGITFGGLSILVVLGYWLVSPTRDTVADAPTEVEATPAEAEPEAEVEPEAAPQRAKPNRQASPDAAKSEGTTEPKLIPYRVIKREAYLHYKVSYDLEVDLVDGRLPNEDELAAIAKHLRSPDHDKTFVCFYLPGMKVDAGAFATGHHTPDLDVAIHPYNIPADIMERLAPPTPEGDGMPDHLLGVWASADGHRMIVRKHEIISVLGKLKFSQRVAKAEVTDDTVRLVIVDIDGKEFRRTWTFAADEFSITDPPSLAETYTRATEREEDVIRNAMTLQRLTEVGEKFEQDMFQVAEVRRYVSFFDISTSDGHIVVYTKDEISALAPPKRQELYQLILGKWRASRYVSDFALANWIEVDEGSASLDPKKQLASKSFTVGKTANETKPRPEPVKPQSPYRTWTDSTGRHTVEAEFVTYIAGNVKLKKKDGSEVTLPMENLSEADQKWVRNRAKR